MFTVQEKKNFEELLYVAGPSGHEEIAIKEWVKQAKRFADRVYINDLGSGVAIIEPTPIARGAWNDSGGYQHAVTLANPNAKTILLDAHIDELGLTITHIDDEGICWVHKIGGWDPLILLGQRVEIYSRKTNHLVAFGVIGRIPAHLQDDKDDEDEVKIKDIWIDIGASTKKETEEVVGIGDYVVIESRVTVLEGNKITSRALDDRAGCFTILKALEIYSRQYDRRNRLVAVASLREEAGTSSTARFPEFNPHEIIVVDVTHASDQPNTPLTIVGEHKLGSGPVINVGTMISKKMIAKLEKIAESLKIPHTVEVNGGETFTNVDPSWLGAPRAEVGLVAIPLRYMHTPVEVIDLDDVENTAKLLAGYAGV
jgi:endoglucanase